jgi:hypothetical protein
VESHSALAKSTGNETPPSTKSSLNEKKCKYFDNFKNKIENTQKRYSKANICMFDMCKNNSVKLQASVSLIDPSNELY